MLYTIYYIIILYAILHYNSIYYIIIPYAIKTITILIKSRAETMLTSSSFILYKVDMAYKEK